MKTILPPRSKEHEAKIKQIAEIVLNKSQDKIAFIILFGSFARGDWVYDYYRENGVMYEYASDYDILLITKNKKHASIDSAIHLKNNIKKELSKNGFDKNPLDKKHSVTIIIESINKVNCELKKDRYFFADIKKEGILLYDSGEFKLSEPKELNEQERKEIARQDYDHWIKRGNNFLKTFKLMFDEKQYSDAAFQLHQATESLYHCAILVFTGYKHKSHDLKELGEIAASQSNQFLTIFPKTTTKQEKCFELLRTAYIEARYNKDYEISKEQLEYLIQRAEKLKEVVEKACENKI
jgi:HEPN domain-containing protein/predicted nucleotidyltransferase